jgi:hypothetical protein
MKDKARIHFVAEHAMAQTRNLANYLRKTGLYKNVDVIEDFEDTVDISFNPLDMKSQLHWLTVFLVGAPNWSFAGPTCPGYLGGIDHPQEKRHMHMINHPVKGDVWACYQLKCRKEHGNNGLVVPRNDDLMDSRDFRMMTSILVHDPAPLRRLNTTDLWRAPSEGDRTLDAAFHNEVLGVRVPVNNLPSGRFKSYEPNPGENISRNDKHKVCLELANTDKISDTRLLGGMSPEMLRGVGKLSQEEAKRIVDKCFEMFPGIRDYATSVIGMLTKENEHLKKNLKESDEALSASNTEVDLLRGEKKKLNKELDEWDRARLIPDNLPKAVDEMLRFLAGVNWQDHARAEQREFLEKFSNLKKAYDEIPNFDTQDPNGVRKAKKTCS